MLRFFYFDDMRHNLLVYFTISTVILFFGPERLIPSLKKVKLPAPVINAPIGDIGGVIMTSRDGRNIYAYKGIPYAEPPVGELRFKKTRPLKEAPWQGIFDGSQSAQKCAQPSGILFWPVFGHEDCLQLNVYVPESQIPKGGLPVMVWFHGGGFVIGDSSEAVYGPGKLLDQDVILVTVNYRLNVFGFLTLGLEEIGGNQGLWDQLQGLKWVQQNIPAFGGNKKKVTIFGESAGGWSVSSHLASSQSKNHYTAAIIQSGPLHFPGLFMDVKKPLYEHHKEYAKKVGCADENDIMKCLRSKSVKELMSEITMFDQCNSKLLILNDFNLTSIYFLFLSSLA